MTQQFSRALQTFTPNTQNQYIVGSATLHPIFSCRPTDFLLNYSQDAAYNNGILHRYKFVFIWGEGVFVYVLGFCTVTVVFLQLLVWINLQFLTEQKFLVSLLNCLFLHPIPHICCLLQRYPYALITINLFQFYNILSIIIFPWHSSSKMLDSWHGGGMVHVSRDITPNWLAG